MFTCVSADSKRSAGSFRGGLLVKFKIKKYQVLFVENQAYGSNLQLIMCVCTCLRRD